MKGKVIAVSLAALGVIGVVAVVGFPAPEPVPTSEIIEGPVPVTPTPSKNKSQSICNPNYSGCLKIGAGDYDCAGGSGNGPNYTGAVQVYGYDEFGLDRDGDGWACE